MTNPCSILKEFIWKHCICVLVLVAVAFAAANYKAVFAWLSFEFGNILWNILTAIGTLTAAVVAYYALNQAKRNAERATFDQYFSQRLASIRETVFDERLSKKTIFYRYKGSDGQKKLKKSKVLIIGAGGLGAPAALYLAGAGVGTIGIVEAVVVSVSNL